MLQKLKNKQGFTLIEIVIVLAIAALIMVIVFFAVAGAQRARRDQERKDLAARLIAQVENWKSNHDGNPPTVANVQDSNSDGFWNRYNMKTNSDPLNGSITYPSTSSIVTSITSCSNKADAGKIEYVLNGKNVTVSICLETGDKYTPPAQ